MTTRPLAYTQYLHAGDPMIFVTNKLYTTFIAFFKKKIWPKKFVHEKKRCRKKLNYFDMEKNIKITRL